MTTKFAQDRDTILLVDGSNLVFRMYYALEYTRMTSPDGRPSWAIFGFFKALLDVMSQCNTNKIIAVFDTKGKTFRHEAFDYYKANRPTEMPDDLKPQWDAIQEGLQLIGIPLTKLEGFEADDLIGSFALQAQQNNWNTVIFSGDRDVLQLVNDDVHVLLPSVKGTQYISPDEIFAKMGVPTEKIIDFKALCGDSSDNIPGVKGVGEKTAQKLLAQFDSLEEIYENIDSVKGTALKQKLINDKENAFDSRYLATIKTDAPFVLDFEEIKTGIKPQAEKLQEFLQGYKLNSLARKLPEVFPELQDKLETNNPKTLETNTLSVRPALPKISHSLINSEELLIELIEKLKKTKMLALDLETTGLDTNTCNIVGWAIAYQTPGGQIKSYYIPVHNSTSKSNSITEEETVQGSLLGTINTETESNNIREGEINNLLVINKFQDLFNNYSGELIIQNTKYEYKILKRLGLKLPVSTLDTMLASYLQDPEQKHGLKAQSQRVFNYAMTEITELIGKNKRTQISMEEVPIDKIMSYACDDAAITLALASYYYKELDKNSLVLWKEMESPLVFLLADMELKGISLNLDCLKELSVELKSEIEYYSKEILKELPEEYKNINLNSSPQVAEALRAKGYKLTKKTASGSYSTDMGVLEKLLELDDTDLIQSIIHYRTLMKLFSTYVESFQELAAHGRIHTEFNQAMTATGRLSSSNPNLQNIPIRNKRFANLIRSTFQASEGCVLIGVDYSQIELRVLAHYTQDKILLEAFNNNQDIHARTASEIFDVPLGEVSSEQRTLGKTLNFALLYQQGAYSTAKQLGISIQEAQDFINKYFEKFSTVKDFMFETLEAAREKNYVETAWGRRRYTKAINADNMKYRQVAERQAFNAPLQGTAADLMKVTMLELNKKLKKLSPEINILLQVHDELLIEVPKELAQKAQDLTQKVMLKNNKLKVPLDISIATGNNWAEIH